MALALKMVLALLRRGPATHRYAVCLAALVALTLMPVGTWWWLQAARLSSNPLTAMLADSGGFPDVVAPNPGSGVLGRWAQPVLPWVSLGWLGGVLLFGGRLAGGWVQTQRLGRAPARPLPPPWPEMAAVVARRIGVRRPVRLLESAEIGTPVVLGWLKPVVLLPVGLVVGVSPAHVEALLAHEFAHLRRHDYLVNVLQRIIESLLFYHPAVWWISRRIRVEREICCDDLAVQALEDRRVLADALVTLAEREAVESGWVLAATGGSLTERVQRLLKEPVAAPVVSGAGFLLSLVLAGCLGATLLWVAQHRTVTQVVATGDRVSASHPSQTETLRRQLAELDSRIARKESEMDQLRMELKVPDVFAESNGDWIGSVAADNERRLMDRVNEIEMHIGRTEVQLQRLRAVDPDRLPIALNLERPTPLLSTLLADLTVAEQMRSNLSERSPAHADEIKRTEAMLSKVKAQIEEVTEGVMNSLQAEMEGDRDRVSRMLKDVAQEKADQARAAAQYRPYLRAKRDLNSMLRMREMMSLQLAVSGNGSGIGTGPAQ